MNAIHITPAQPMPELESLRLEVRDFLGEVQQSATPVDRAKNWLAGSKRFAHRLGHHRQADWLGSGPSDFSQVRRNGPAGFRSCPDRLE